MDGWRISTNCPSPSIEGRRIKGLSALGRQDAHEHLGRQAAREQMDRAVGEGAKGAGTMEAVNAAKIRAVHGTRADGADVPGGVEGVDVVGVVVGPRPVVEPGPGDVAVAVLDGV